MMQSRKALLLNWQLPWVKKDVDEDFDIPIGTAKEICEIVGSYLLNLLSNR